MADKDDTGEKDDYECPACGEANCEDCPECGEYECECTCGDEEEE